MDKRILIIEDEPDISNILSYSFRNEGFIVNVVESGEDGIEEFIKFKPNVVLLDLMLPGIDGFEVCSRLAKFDAPIIMLTARNDIVDKIKGLELGADDYITKPFNIKECIVRVNVALRRMDKIINSEDGSCINIDNIKINIDSKLVYLNNEEVKLKPRERGLLFYLLSNKNVALSREKILDSVWGYDYYGDPRTVDVHIRRLRQKLDNKELIQTSFGTGYMLKVDK